MTLSRFLLATWMVAGCSGRVDLGGSNTRDARPAGTGAVATESGGSDGSGGAMAGASGSGGVSAGGASATGGASSGGLTGSGGASGGSVNDGSATGGAPGSGGVASGGAMATGGTSSGGAMATGGTSSGGATRDSGASSGGAPTDAAALSGLGEACGYNWDCDVTAAGCDSTLGGCACDVSSHVCVASHCVDGRRDGTESDVDCGGQCAGCGPGEVCYHDADCSLNASGCDQCACDLRTSTCVIDHCADERIDVDETDLDCGGAKCARCANGLACKVDSDCTSNAGCDPFKHWCVYRCLDGHQDFDETDADCGGATCNSCLPGQKCLTNLDCQSGHFCNTSKVCQ